MYNLHSFAVAAPQTNTLFGAPASQPSTGFGITPTTGFSSFGSQPNQVKDSVLNI